MLKFISLIKTICIVLLASTFGCHRHSTDHLYNAQKSIAEIKSLHEMVDNKYPYRGVVKVIPLFKQDKFNANEYFNILTNIKPPTGSELDFVYYNNAGQPILYFRKYDEQMNPTYSEFRSKYGTVYKDYSEASEIADMLEVDGTNESYIELILFREYAGKFHRPNRDWCGTPYLYAQLKRKKMIEKCLKQNEKLPSEEPVFVVERNDADTVLVSKTEFSAYSFEHYRSTYQISKSIPHRITLSGVERTSACADFVQE